MFPIFLLLGFRFGFFTATEAGAVVVAYALFVGLFIYHELTWKDFIQAMEHSVVDIGMVMLIITMAAALGYAITLEQAPAAITEFLAGFAGSPYVTLFIVLGCCSSPAW